MGRPMGGIKIPQQDFALKMQRGGGGGGGCICGTLRYIPHSADTLSDPE